MAGESLFKAGRIKLFGRPVDDLKVGSIGAGSPGPDSVLGRLHASVGPDPTVARIYGFSYDGQYHDLLRPAIFLVVGEGDPANATVENTALALEPCCKLNDDLRVWELDQSDFTVRLDVETGPLERILLELEIGPEQERGPYVNQANRMGYAGGTVRLRYAGGTVRLQGGGSGSD